MAGNGLLELAVVGAPDLDELVGRRTSQPLAIGTELNRGHGLGVTGQRELERVVGLETGRGAIPATATLVWVGSTIARSRRRRRCRGIHHDRHSGVHDFHQLLGSFVLLLSNRRMSNETNNKRTRFY